jgi:hypothetical protein
VADDRGDRREHHNYGWIGLLGLLGLTGLMRKRHENRQIDYSDRADTRWSMANSHSEQQNPSADRLRGSLPQGG